MAQQNIDDLSKQILQQALDLAQLPADLQLLDITMRDGAHVVDFSNAERLQLATFLGELGVHRIEIESRAYVIRRQSIYSPEDHWKTLKEITKLGLKSEIFTQRNVADGQAGIDRALQCDVNHIVLQEPVQRGWLAQQGQTEEERLRIIQELIEYAKAHGCFITFFNSHIFKADLDYLLRVITAGVEAGADSLCITDSEGLGTPHAFRSLVTRYLDVTKRRIPIETHPHNDFGLALANTLAGYEAGASVIHCSVNGLGSRAGNTRLEECVIALRTLFDLDLGLEYSRLHNVCELVELIQQWPTAKNKPFYGYGVQQAPYDLASFGKRPHYK
jgi:isopropylmalate/homocitrate/citramalate synthase